jgi:hypothetical protein
LSEDFESRGGLGRRLLIYGAAAMAVFAITMLVVLLPEGRLTLRLGFSSTEETLDTLLIILTVLLLALFLAKLASRALAGRKAPEPPPVSPDAAISFDGTNLTIMGSDFRIPEFMTSMVLHVLENHGSEIAEKARRLQVRSGGEDLGGANWLFAFMEILSAHSKEAEESVFRSMALTAAQLVRSGLARKRGKAGNDQV